jgi:4-aminobutyrate aminotransferase
VEERDMLVREALNRGLIIFRGGKSAIRIAPPLVISREKLELGLDIFEEALREVERKC